MLDFLLSGDQELARGAEVGRLLLRTRRDDAERFARDVKDLLLDERVRFHVKDAVLALLRALPDPSAAELQLVLDLLDDEAWRRRVAEVLPEPPWFDHLEDSGVLAGWLGSGDSKLEQRAVWVIGMAGSARPGRAGELLAPLAERPDFVKWMPWVAQTIDLAADRRFFDAFLGALRRGQLDEYELGLFSAVLSLGDTAPAWVVDVLAAWLVERPGALEADADGIVALRSWNLDLFALIRLGAEGAPEEFAERLLPYMQQVMLLTEQGDAIPRPDRHFSGGMLAREVEHVEKMLLPAMASALIALAETSPERLRELVEPLVDDIHAAAQELLYVGLTRAGEAHAEWIAQLLLRGGPALECGYTPTDCWRARDLLAAAAPHMSDESRGAVETLVGTFVPQWEAGDPDSAGAGAFTLLTAVGEQLSEAGYERVRQLSVKLGRLDPEMPEEFVRAWLGEPIEQGAEYMRDSQWFNAMRRHKNDEDEWDTLDVRGGASELARVLQRAAAGDPQRFMRFALKIDGRFNGLYLDAILRGVAESSEGVDPELAREVVRHAVALGGHGPWLAGPLTRLEGPVPEDVAASMPAIDELVASADPAVREAGARIAVHALNAAALTRLFDDPDEQVRAVAAGFLTRLNGQRLAGHRELLAAFIASPALGDGAELVAFLELAPEPEPELTLQLAGREIAADGFPRLLVRAYSGAEDAALRAQLLDVIDRLLEAGTDGMAEAIAEARP